MLKILVCLNILFCFVVSILFEVDSGQDYFDNEFWVSSTRCKTISLELAETVG